MKLKIATVGMACIMGLMPLQQVFAVYPESGGVVDFNETYTVGQTQSWQPSPRENIFTVDGKSFILLDTDAEGNYFVLSEEHYGTHVVESGIPNKLELQTAVTENGKTVFTDKGADLSNVDGWRFNPERKTNIAYWLNNAFVSEGNTKEHQFPKRVYNHIIEKNWTTEGFNAYRGWTAAQYYDQYFGVSNALNFANSFKGNSYTVTAKLALLSYTEYMQYKDKIGVTFNNAGGWSGMLLRTSDAMVTSSTSGNTRSLSMTRSPLMVRTRNADKNDSSNMIIAYADAIASDNYFVRPCFWLSKDFFKEVPCELEWSKDGSVSIGRYPLEKIKSHTYEELRTIYTDGQLEALGYETPHRDFGNYPQHSSEIKDLKAGESSSTGIEAYYQSPKENLFSVDGKSFILLDKDSDGNYFVMANEEYGQRIFSENSFDSKLCAESEWYFDPENKKSIAYWLNHEFLTKGNRFKGDDEIWQLPQIIRDSMMEREWEIEPHYPISGWTVNSYASNEVKAEIENWKNAQIDAAKKRTVTCKTALMSFTEYQQYKDKIGMTALAGGYAGFLLRTPRAQADAEKDGSNWRTLIGPLQVSNSISQNKLVFSTAGAANDIYFVRPVFWLSKDFFSKNPLNIDELGDKVKNEIAVSYDYYDMRDIYSAEEMRRLGINPEREKTDAIPEAERIVIEGISSVGNELTGGYKYISNDSSSPAAAERNSLLRWYISNDISGTRTLYAEGRKCKLDLQSEGKYIWFGVTPQNAYGNTPENEYLSRPVLVLQKQNIDVKQLNFTNKNGDEVTNLNGLDVLNVDISFNSGDECKVFVLAYDSDGKLIGMKSETTQPGLNDKRLTLTDLSSDGGAYARIMIFKSDDLTTPLFTELL